MKLFTEAEMKEFGLTPPSQRHRAPLPEDEDGIFDPSYLLDANLIPAMTMMGLGGMFASKEAMENYPDGFMYMPDPSVSNHAKALGEKFMRFFDLMPNIQSQSPEMLPYIRQSSDGNGYELDVWYFLASYDAITIHTALDYLVGSVIDDDDEHFLFYSKLFYLLKKKAISGGINVPFGRDILLNSFCRDSADVKRHFSVIIDRLDFFQFVVEDSGIDIEHLPGAILLAYEKECKLDLTARPTSDTQPDTQVPTDEPPILMGDLMEYAKQLFGHHVSRGTIRRTLIAQNVEPCGVVLVDRAKCNAYPCADAKSAVEKWVEANKR